MSQTWPLFLVRLQPQIGYLDRLQTPIVWEHIQVHTSLERFVSSKKLRFTFDDACTHLTPSACRRSPSQSRLSLISLHSAIPALSYPGPVRYPWRSVVELQVPADETSGLMTPWLHPHNTNVLQSITYAQSPYPPDISNTGQKNQCFRHEYG